jgi:hypothetical protein
VRDLAFALVYSDTDSINSLNAGSASILLFNPPTINTSGQYSYLVSTSNASDLNPGNNQRLSEIEVINACSPVVLSYHTPNLPDQQISWNAGTGVFYKPPVYPLFINSLDFFIQNGLGDGFTANIYANNGAFGTAGTLMTSQHVAAAEVVSGAWNTVDLPTPVEIDSAGFYVVFFQDGPNIFLGLETAFPISRNTYEILDGAWAAYRENENQDAAFRVQATPPGLDISTTLAAGTISSNQAGATYQWLDCNNSYAIIPGETSQDFTPLVNGSYAIKVSFAGCIDTSGCTTISNAGIEDNLLIHARIFPNPASSWINIEFTGNVLLENATLQITDISGKRIMVPYQVNSGSMRLNIDQLSSGIYTYQLSNNGQVYAIGKFIRQ